MNIRKLILIAGILLTETCLTSTTTAQGYIPRPEVYFSPKGNITQAVVNEIDAAQKSIHVMVYTFTSAPIAKALVNAHRRHINVTIILDKSQRTQKYSSADFTANAGIPTWIDARHAIQHNKVIIIDEKTVITGSFNFTKAAEESNAENLLIIRDQSIAKTYLKNWNLHKSHSTHHQPRNE
jgi:phosphatidylserine/phosphatidylglycerophosphate/cardiolipin synthase-like enzyme